MKDILIKGKRLTLRSLKPSDVTQTYLDWLNNDELQQYTRRRNKVTTIDELKQFVINIQNSADCYLAIVTEVDKHIGNIFLNYIDQVNKSADLSIMIGDKGAHGKGYAKEAINLITKLGFEDLGLHRIYACSPNQAFNKMIDKVGWKSEGIKRQCFLVDGKYLDMECWSILESEFNQK